MYIHTHIHTHTHIHIHIPIPIHIHIHIHMHMHVNTYTYEYMYTYVYIYINYICTSPSNTWATVFLLAGIFSQRCWRPLPVQRSLRHPKMDGQKHGKSQRKMAENWVYPNPLVNLYRTNWKDRPCYQWESSPCLWPCSIAMLVIARGYF